MQDDLEDYIEMESERDPEFAEALARADAAYRQKESRREYVVAYTAHNGNVCTIRTPNTPTVLREYAEKDAEAARSPEDQTELYVAFRDTPAWQRATDGD